MWGGNGSGKERGGESKEIGVSKDVSERCMPSTLRVSHPQSHWSNHYFIRPPTTRQKTQLTKNLFPPLQHPNSYAA